MLILLLLCALSLPATIVADVTLCRATELGSPSGSADTNVVLQIDERQGALSRRDKQPYLTSTGDVTPECILGSIYNIKAGRLYTDDAFYSVPEEASSAPFASRAGNLGISIVFAVADGILYWDNKTFDDGTARFCINRNDVVQAVFRGPLPGDCSPIAIRIVPASSCPRIGASAVGTGSGRPLVVARSTATPTGSLTSFADVFSTTPLPSIDGSELLPSFIQTPPVVSPVSTSPLLGGFANSVSSVVSFISSASSTTSMPSVTSPPSEVATATSSTTTTTTSTTEFRSALVVPTPLVGDPFNAPENVDSGSYQVPLRFVMELYGQFADTLQVSTDGVISFNAIPGCSNRSNDTSYAHVPLPTAEYNNVTCSAEKRVSVLPPYSICPYWDDMSVAKGQPQGIWYEYTRDGLTLEFQLQSTADPRKKYHFLWFYFYKAPGTFTINYVNTTDKGAGATVGIQGEYGKFLQYSYNERVIQDGLVLTIDTNTNNFTASNGVRPRTFNEFPAASR